jgi:hypothetical protein
MPELDYEPRSPKKPPQEREPIWWTILLVTALAFGIIGICVAILKRL